MSIRTKIILVTLGVAIPAFAGFPFLFPPDPHVPGPTGMQLPLLMALSAVECLLLGGGVAFLAFGWPYVRRLSPAAPARAVAIYISLAWLMTNWYPHLGLHIQHGVDMDAIVVVDYVFHLPLYVTPVVLLWAVLALARDARAAEDAAPTEAQLASR